MDAKEIKTALKNAREAIRNKEFKDALKHCKAILSGDANNYMALVLIAVAAEGLEQYDQALKAYKRAIEADGTQILAWQGLCSFYEKNTKPEYVPDQIETYIKMLDFHTSEREKKIEALQKVTKLLNKETETVKRDKISEVYTSVIQEETHSKKKTHLQIQLLNILQLSDTDQNTDQIQELARAVLESDKEFDKDIEKILKLHLSLLIKRNSTEVVNECQHLLKKFPESTVVLEYSIITELDTCIGWKVLSCSERLQGLITAYETSLDGELSEILKITQGVLALCGKEYVRARNTFKESGCKFVCVAYFQALSSWYLHKHDEILQFCQNGLKMLVRKDRILTRSSSEVTCSFQLIRVRALSALGDKMSLAVAMETIEKELDGKSDSVKALKGQVYLKQGETEKAKECVVTGCVDGIVLEGLIAIQEDQMTLAADKFQEAVQLEPDTVSHQVSLARCLWNIETRRAECFTILLKAAKQDPCNSETFLYLGHYYSKVASDTARSRKCYQKAFDLDPKNAGAGEALCDVLNSQGEEEQAHKMLLDVTEKASAGCAKWAWLRLGLYQVKHEDPSIAVASFQSALRADPKDPHVWECLGEAYLARGSYTASLKAFTRASELNPESMYCLFQIASIKQTLGTYTEAIEEYKLILEKSPNYVPALKGVGESYVCVAKGLLSKFFDGRARDMAQLAVQHLCRAASLRSDLSCLWKLIGDACTILHVLPAQDFSFQKPDKGVLTKLETLELGGRCYIRALKILPECSSLWHDLGVNYIHQSMCSTEKQAISLAERSVQALKKAIQLEPTNHKHWNALGYVACLKVYNKPDLAQHCFIKSIQAESNNVVAWTNLATLYLSKDNVQLAHEAFKVAQSLEPSYVSCWIGQAIIAEVVGHQEAMDLFRHTTELGNHIESAIGYSHWVCTMLQNIDKRDTYMYTYAIEQMGSVPVASDALGRYTDRVKTNPVAYNMHGLLLERQKLYRTAVEQFKQSILLFEAQEDKSSLPDVMCNYARVLYKAGEYEESSALYDKLAGSCTVVDLCHWGLALYKAGNLDLESFQVYTKAVELVESDGERSCILTALAMVLFKFGDLDNAKTNLFQSSQLADRSVAGLKALCALGLLQSDLTLAEAVLQEILGLKEDPNHVYDITLLDIGVEIIKGNLIDVKRKLQDLLHKDPSQPKIWHLLSTILLKFYPQSGQSASQAARISRQLGDRLQSDYLLLTLSELSAGNHSNTQNSDDAFKTAQRAVLLHPDKIENWACLAAAVHGQAILTPSWERRLALLKQEYTILCYTARQEVTAALKLWCIKQKIVCTVHANMHDTLMECLDELMTEFGSDGEAKQIFGVFSNALQDNHAGLAKLLDEQSAPYYWQILVEMYVKAGLLKDVEKTLLSCHSHLAKSDGNKAFLMKMAHFAFQQIMRNSGDSDHYRDVFKETTDQLLQNDRDCTIVTLMQGVLNLHGNTRLAKHQLQRTLNLHPDGSKGQGYSIARRGLIHILVTSKKDPEIVQSLLKGAELAEDKETLNYYEKLTV